MNWFRQCDRRYPFFWEAGDQPSARWHDDGEGPVQYLASTPEGAWAEFLRHEEIADSADLAGICRALWVIDDRDESLTAAKTSLPISTSTGGPDCYSACRLEARQLRATGTRALLAPSAALLGSVSTGYRVELGFRSVRLDAHVLMLFGRRPNLVGLLVLSDGRPPPEVLRRVRPLS